MEIIIIAGIGGMLLFAIGVIVFVLIHQRRVIKYQMNLQKLREDQQKLLLHAAIESEEKERHRIADELHDEVGASLSAIGLYLRQLTAKNKINGDLEVSASTARKVLDQVIADVRQISHRLSPEMLVRFGLTEALQHFVQTLQASGAIKTAFFSAGKSIRLQPERELAVYRIIQEVLGNMLKHAGASEMEFKITQKAQSLVITIEDNGNGFTQDTFDQLKSSPGGLGLKNIQSRIDILGANINFTKRNGGAPGTLMTLDVPQDS